MFHARFFTLVALAMSLALTACKGCGDPPVVLKDQCVGVAGAQADRNDACTENAECGDHHACRDVKDKAGVKCCVFVDRACNTEADCCPGQSCPSERKKCFDRFTECTKDEDCGDRGDRVCEPYADGYGPQANRCRYRTCGPLGECAVGQSCFQGECLAVFKDSDLPCEGKCDPGQACLLSANRCQNYSNPEGRPGAACPMSCNVGFIATFKDSRNLWDSCQLPPVQCVCAELPGLVSNDLGRFSAIASNGSDGLLASTYDGKFGDLVVYRYDATGKKIGADSVDGVPAGTAKYGPSGARGGIAEPGPDVGRYTDIVVNNGIAYVSYYDVTNGDLKMAVRQNGVWTSHRVDGVTADLGLYSSIGVDADGLPGVAYFMRAAESSFNAADCPAPAPTGALKDLTALRFARARVASPRSDADWTVRTVACLSKPPPPCTGCTGTCADTGSGPTCLTTAMGCAPACDANTEVCVNGTGRDGGAAATCGKKYNPSQLVDVPLGVGVFASLAFNGKNAIIAYMQRTGPVVAGRVVPDGDLYAVQIDAQNAAGRPVLLDGAGDTGYFPDVKLEPTTRQIAIAYHDFSSKSLKFYFAAQLQTGVTIETIDRGVDAARPGEQSFVGTDSALVFGPQPGQVWAVYQDATRGDLKLSRRTTTWQPQSSLATQGAVGFFADAVFANGRVWATHARIKSRVVGGEAQLDNALLLEQGPQN